MVWFTNCTNQTYGVNTGFMYMGHEILSKKFIKHDEIWIDHQIEHMFLEFIIFLLICSPFLYLLFALHLYIFLVVSLTFPQNTSAIATHWVRQHLWTE